MNNIDVLIFSKDRPAQLDLTLQTLKNHFKEWRSQKYTILYTYSNKGYEQAYNRTKSYHSDPQFTWHKETNFKNNVIEIFNNGIYGYQSFLVDDDVFIDDFSLDSYEFNEFKNNTEIACLSPRIAPYVNYCYTARISTPPPKMFINKNVWNWKNPDLSGDWNYTQSIASFHIFKKGDLIRNINNVPFRAPNSFEGSCLAPNPPHHRPLMICFDRCKVICGTNNRVQTENSNYHENSHTPDSLCQSFLTGKRLNPYSNDGIIVPMCHGPVKLEFV